jgi:DMSO/TMAO reductase YedYZ molybdopterin-dependent catalytic subunit
LASSRFASERTRVPGSRLGANDAWVAEKTPQKKGREYNVTALTIFKRTFLAALIVAGLGSSASAQGAAPSAPPATAAATDTLSVGGALETPLTLSLADLAKMPRTTVNINEDGVIVPYSGVLLAEVMKRAGAPSGAKLRGKALATYLLCEAKDGYRAVLALAEFDADFSDNPILVADTRDGKPLFDYQGPFRLIAPRDKRAARGVRRLTKLTLVQVE